MSAARFAAANLALRAALLGVAGSLLLACGGGAPLLHPAHVLPPGSVSVGAGLSGQLALKPLPAETSQPFAQPLQNLGVTPGVAPWLSARMGFESGNEGGLTWSGRALRLDVRHAFELGPKLALSLGLGGSAVIAHRPGDQDGSSVFGGGGDVPLLFGYRSAGDVLSLWIGPRGGFELLSGQFQLGETGFYKAQGRHFYGTMVAGLRVGFRHVHVAVELDGGYHAVTGTFTGTNAVGTTSGPATSTNVQQWTLTPAGALEITF
jgi:hypothetical protein